MKTLKKSLLIFSLLILLLIIFGATLAFYGAKRKAEGTLMLDKGIFVEFGNVNGATNSRQLILNDGSNFDSLQVVPNQIIEIKNPYIKSLTNSVDFYLKVKLEYFFNNNGNLEVIPTEKLQELVQLNEFNNVLNFNSKFLPDANNEWFYLCKDENQTLTQENLYAISNGESINIFENSFIQIENFSCEFGSPNDIENIEILLTINAVQATKDFSSVPELSNDSIAPTVIELNGGNVKYQLENNRVEILEFNGDILIEKGQLPEVSSADEIIIAADAYINVTNTDFGKLLYIYDKYLLDYFAIHGYIAGDEENSLVSKIVIATNEELYAYVFSNLTGEVAEIYELWSYFIVDSEINN